MTVLWRWAMDPPGTGLFRVKSTLIPEGMVTQEKANNMQVAGDHYKSKAIQPWDFIAANAIGFFEGNAIKYLSRWREKGGVEDLRKARHYIDKLIELYTPGVEK